MAQGSKVRSPLERKAPVFYGLDGKWNHQYLRIAAVYRCMVRYGMGITRAVELLAERRVENPRRLVELWLTGEKFRRLNVPA